MSILVSSICRVISQVGFWLFHLQRRWLRVIAGTTNHIAACDWTQLVVENSKITAIREGGDFGHKLREVMDETADTQYPTFPKGHHGMEASIGTNPHIHRPRKDFPSGFVNCLMRGFVQALSIWVLELLFRQWQNARPLGLDILWDTGTCISISQHIRQSVRVITRQL